MAEVSRRQVLTSIKTCLTSGDYSDLTIICGEDTHHVHKMIVCIRADFFARAVKFGGKEAQAGTISLPDDGPKVVALLVQYLYESEYEPELPDSQHPTHATVPNASSIIIDRTKQYDSEYGSPYTYEFPHTCSRTGSYCKKYVVFPHHICKRGCGYSCIDFCCDKCTRKAINGPASQLLTHAKMYEIADKYDVVGLKELCKEKFSQCCEVFWDDLAFPPAADYAYSTTMEEDGGLKDIVSSIISKHMELIRKAEIQVLMAKFNGLSLGILLRKADELGWV